MSINEEHSTLPTQHELAQLAATLLTRQSGYYGGASRAVKEALEVWREAGKLIIEQPGTLGSGALERREEMGQLRLPMMVGRHYLPPIPDSFFETKSFSYDDFLEIVIGLTDKGDREKWFRSYLESTGNRYLKNKGKEVDYLRSCKENGFTMNHAIDPFGLPSKLISHIKLFIDENHSSDYFAYILATPTNLAIQYRRWRLTMKTHKETAKCPYELEECLMQGNKKFRELEKKRLEQ